MMTPIVLKDIAVHQLVLVRTVWMLASSVTITETDSSESAGLS